MSDLRPDANGAHLQSLCEQVRTPRAPTLYEAQRADLIRQLEGLPEPPGPDPEDARYECPKCLNFHEAPGVCWRCRL